MEDDAGILLDRSSRATRGKRLTKLVDEEVEADEQFWGQEALKEEAVDSEYEAEEEDVDVFDSDFDEDETNVEEEVPEDDEQRFRVKKKKIFPFARKIIKDKKRMSAPKTKGLADIEAAAATDSNESIPRPSSVTIKEPDETIELIENSVDLEGERIVRKSTRTAVVVRQAERDALRAAMQATIKPAKKKREGEEKRITQEDMLLEAAQTEIMNRQNLERMLAREEEVKQKAIVHKKTYSGPQIRFYSRDGNNFLVFMGGEDALEELSGQVNKPCSRKSTLCAVTGLPAKYVDPLTSLPYATKEAFRIIRARVDRENSYIQKKNAETGWRRPRSGRSSSGHANGIKSRRNKLSASFYGYPNGLPSGMETSLVGFDVKDETLGSRLPEYHEAENIGQAAAERSSQQPVSVCSLFEERSGGPVVRIESLEAVEPIENHSSATGLNESPVSLLSNLKVPLWMEIPPPREEPSGDEYMLDDLTSLNFGPILSLQHGVTGQDLRDLELDIECSHPEMMLPLDELPIPKLSENDFI